MQRLIDAIRGDLRQDTLRGTLVRAASATAAMKIASAGLAFLTSLLYARVLGPHDFGLYAYVIAWVGVLTVPANLGFTSYLVREGAKAPGHLAWLRHWGDRRMLLTGIVAALLLVCGAFFPQAAGARRLFLIAAVLPLLANLSAVRQALLQAAGRIAESQWPQLVFAPMVTLAGLFAWWLWRGHFDTRDVLVAILLAAIAQLLLNALHLRRSERNRAPEGDAPAASVRAALPFMWIGALHLVLMRVDLIILGSLNGASDAGIYAIASRASEFVPFFMVAANTAIGPRIAHLYHADDRAALQALATRVARRLFWTSLPLAFVLLVGSRWLLTHFYGEAYAGGALALAILTLAQLFTVVSGPVGILLNMTEHAGASARAFAVGAGLNVILNLILVPRYGYAGAAVATAISVAVCNTMRWIAVRRLLGIRPSAFGI